MKHKVLIADDSLTIQKVVRITLSGEPYDIYECDDRTGLYDIVESESPSLVFLDFSLDEGVSGYEICKHIIKKSPTTKVMMMYGTFDSIDDELYTKSGASAKIIKPFDGQKFITICHQLLGSNEFFGIESDDESLEAVEKHLDIVNKELSHDFDSDDDIMSDLADLPVVEEVIEIDDDDLDDSIEWELDNADREIDDGEVEPIKADKIDKTDENISGEFDFSSLLSDDLKEWGMSIPEELKVKNEFIEAHDEHLDLSHEIVEKVSEIASHSDLDSDSFILDEIDDDDDDSLEEIEAELKAAASMQHEEKENHFNFSPNEDGELEADVLIDFTDEENNEDKFSHIEQALEDELGNNDLWSVDEHVGIIDDDEDDLDDIDEFDHAEEVSQSSELAVSVNSLDIEEAVRKYMTEHGRSLVEKIAWEMIPDLAENIIREEVKALADKVLKDKS